MNNQPENSARTQFDAKTDTATKKKKNSAKDIPQKAQEAMKQLREMNQTHIPSDTLGSYTGTAYDGDIPSQDADDL